MHSFGYLFREGVKNLWKNRTMSIASIGVLISCLLLTGIAGLLTLNLSVMMKSLEGNNSVTFYLEDTTPRLTSIQFGEQLRLIENVKEYTFIPKETALETMIDMLGEDGSLLYELAGDDNFFPDAYSVTMKDLSSYRETIDQVYAIGGVSDHTDYSDMANKLSNLDKIVRYCSIGIVAVLAVVSLFIISNTIKVTMFSRRMEISIMKSVGATNGFVRIPFIVEAMIIGVVSGLLSAIILSMAYDKIIEVVMELVPFLSAVDIAPFTWILYVGYVVIGMLFGILGGGISIGKYLKKEGEQAIV